MPKGKPVTARAKGRPVRTNRPGPPPAAPAPATGGRAPSDRWVVRESRSVRSVWVWRAFLLMSLLAIGVAIVLAANGYEGLAVAWGVIAAGWFGISMWLWRQHSRAATGS